MARVIGEVLWPCGSGDSVRGTKRMPIVEQRRRELALSGTVWTTGSELQRVGVFGPVGLGRKTSTPTGPEKAKPVRLAGSLEALVLNATRVGKPSR